MVKFGRPFSVFWATFGHWIENWIQFSEFGAPTYTLTLYYGWLCSTIYQAFEWSSVSKPLRVVGEPSEHLLIKLKENYTILEKNKSFYIEMLIRLIFGEHLRSDWVAVVLHGAVFGNHWSKEWQKNVFISFVCFPWGN